MTATLLTACGAPASSPAAGSDTSAVSTQGAPLSLPQ